MHPCRVTPLFLSPTKDWCHGSRLLLHTDNRPRVTTVSCSDTTPLTFAFTHSGPERAHRFQHLHVVSSSSSHSTHMRCRLLSMTSFVAGDKAADLGEDTNNTGSGGSSGGSGGRSSGGHASVSGIFNWFDAGSDRPGSRSGHPGSGSGQGSGSNGNQSAGSGLLSQHASGLDQAVNIVTIPAPTIPVLTDPTYSDLSSARWIWPAVDPLALICFCCESGDWGLAHAATNNAP
jgi:hypothetical protein